MIKKRLFNLKSIIAKSTTFPTDRLKIVQYENSINNAHASCSNRSAPNHLIQRISKFIFLSQGFPVLLVLGASQKH